MNGPPGSDLLPFPVDEIVYPDSDGEPMGETEPHVRVIMDLFHTLDELFQPQAEVFVICNMLLFYERGNAAAFKSPDVMVVKGVDTSEYRRSFKIWEENAVPCVVFEMTSEKTRREDEEAKPRLYARLGIAEYFLFDPLGDYLSPQFQGYRLTNGVYTPLVPDADGGLVSLELGLRLVPDGIYLRLFNAATNRPILSPVVRQLQEAERRAEEEKRRADEEKRRADKEKRRADEEKRQTDEEKKRADAAEAELARLRQEFEQLKQPKQKP
jgi:Uma2 family endonuclease